MLLFFFFCYLHVFWKKWQLLYLAAVALMAYHFFYLLFLDYCLFGCSGTKYTRFDFSSGFFFVLFDWVRVRMRQLPYQIAVALIIKVDTFVFFFFGARWLGPLPSPIAVAPILLTTSCFFFALALRFRYAHSYAFHSLVAIFRPFYRVFLPLRHLSGKSFLFAMAADYQMNENIFLLFLFTGESGCSRSDRFATENEFYYWNQKINK